MVNGVELVRATLVADKTGVSPGKTLRLGVLLDIAPGWHVYWRNPGDSGLPTTLTWDLPAGFIAESTQWALPRRIVEPGDLHIFGYKGQVLLFMDITIPAGLSAPEATFRVKANWLVCQDICVPGEASMELTLPVVADAQAQNAELFEQAEARLPKTGNPNFLSTWKWNDKGWQLSLSGLPEGITVADFLPLEGNPKEPGHTETGAIAAGNGVLRIPTEGTVKGLLLLLGGQKEEGWILQSPQGIPEQAAAEMPLAPTSEPKLSTVPTVEPTNITLWIALLYGMLGGLILNLMPCVLPVISLKIFGFIRQAGDSPQRILRHGLAFTSGIFLWFLGLGAVVAILRSSGEQVTWAFQFQNPWFILFIAVVVFVFSLNLFGVFEISLPSSAGTKMSNLASQEGYSGSFFQGIFATLLATPCTAPFLGTALGFAFSQSIAVIFAMFASVAFGMSLPYLLLSAQPRWISILPKPGGWMERLKQFMGFPLLATLLWLLSVLGGQKGVMGILWTASLLLCLAFACWLYGAFFCNPASTRARFLAGIFALLSAGGGSYFFGSLFANLERPNSSTATSQEGIPWVAFSEKTLTLLLAEGKPVFIDFTADWCITCKFNERTAINTVAFRTLLAQKGIVPVKADWTNSDPEITTELRKFGRVGVPFYVYYPQGNKSEPVIFPEIITEAMLLEKIREK